MSAHSLDAPARTGDRETAAPPPPRPRRRPGAVIGMVLRYLAVIALAVFLLFPVYYAVVGSVMGPADIASYPPALIPHSLHLENYRHALQIIPLARQYGNSVITAGVISLLQLVTAVLSAYAFVFLPMPLRRTMFALFLVTIMVPFEATVIPNYLLVSKFGLTGSYIGSLSALALPFLAAGFGTFLMRQTFRSFPAELRDAARIDGCGHLRFIARILVPLTKPSLAALGVYVFLNSWNMYFWPLLVTGDSPGHQTIQIGISQLQSADSNDPGMVLAGVVLALIPTLLLVLFGQRFIVRGLTAGAVK